MLSVEISVASNILGNNLHVLRHTPLAEPAEKRGLVTMGPQPVSSIYK